MEITFLPRFFGGRLQVLFLFFSGAFAVILFALFYTQIMQGDTYRQLSVNNRVRRILVEAPRGRILDRNGVVLADNRPRFDLAIIREELPKEKTQYVESLAKFLGIEQKIIWRALQSTANVPYLPALVARDLDIATVTRVEEKGEELPALQIQVQPTRFYAFGDASAHWVGTVGKIPESEIDNWKEKGVSPQESIGVSGVEKALDSSLRGKTGGMQVQVNNRGYLDKVLGSVEAVPGKDLVLTMDVRLQKILSEAFGNKQGAGVALDPRTGEILALVSRPSFDPNLFVTGADAEKINSLLNDPGRPLYSRFNQGLYSPGSLFKIIVALAYLREQSDAAKTKKVFCDGVFELGEGRFRCWKTQGHGSLGLIEAIKYSCNIFFYTIALDLGPEKIGQMASAFGFGKKTGFLLGEREGFVPTPQWKKERFHQSWYGGDTANFAIGQGATICTPVQMAAFLAAIATDGMWRTPILVKGSPQTQIDLSVLAPQIQIVKEGMKRVVQDPDGTGHRAFVAALPAAGKTGTVEVSKGGGEKIKHTWFGSFAPADRPEIVVAVMVEEGESGGLTAAPIVKKVYEGYAKIREDKQLAEKK